MSLADLDIGTWTAEQGTTFEAAEWVLGSLIAHTSAAAAAEKNSPAPDQGRLDSLANERAHFAGVRRQLTVHDTDGVEEVLHTYGAMARPRTQAAESRERVPRPDRPGEITRDE